MRGLKKKVRKVERRGIFASRIRARPKDKTTARGTVIAEKVNVFFAASLKDELFRTDLKLLMKTKFP
jgi:hypothetical protein